MRPYHIFVSCFDVSADHHATRLIRYLQTIWQDQVVWSVIGGEELLALSRESDYVCFLEECATQSTIGLLEGVREGLRAPKLLSRIRRFLSTGQYDSRASLWGHVQLLLAIDGQGRNLILGKIAHQLGIRTAYLFPPLVFVWGRWNIRKMQVFDHIFCPFLPNVQLYENHHLNATHIGHPFIYYRMANPLTTKTRGSQISDKPFLAKPKDKKIKTQMQALKQTLQAYDLTQRIQTLKKTLGLKPNQWVISLFPGSRHQEINRLTPLFLRVITELLNRYPQGIPSSKKSNKPHYHQLRFVLALAHEDFREKIEDLRDQAGLTPTTLPILHNAYEEILKLSHLALTCSGTVTFKAAFLATPHILTYQISWLSYWIARFLLQMPFIGMLNILENRPVVLELINNNLSVASLTAAIEKYLHHPKIWQQNRHELTSLVHKIYKAKKLHHPFHSIEKELSSVIFPPP